MQNYLDAKSIVVTGAGSGFGRLVSERAAKLGAHLTCVDYNEGALSEVVSAIQASGGTAHGVRADVSEFEQVSLAATAAVQRFGRIDVMINNAGIMPLGFYADHEEGLAKWHRCIDVNFKGVLNGIVSVFDQMMAQGHGHVVNISSIYGNFPVTGAAVYGATKSAVNFLSESLRVEARGKIKVTIVKPTGVPGTSLSAGVVNRQASIGIVGQNRTEFVARMQEIAAGTSPAKLRDPSNIGYVSLDPAYIAEQIIYVINQPLGVSVGDITIRASGDHYIL